MFGQVGLLLLVTTGFAVLLGVIILKVLIKFAQKCK